MLAGYLLNLIGAFIRWVFGSIWRTIVNRKRISFYEYASGNENTDALLEDSGMKTINLIVGIVVILSILYIIFRLF
jgi:hypothetical protein